MTDFINRVAKIAQESSERENARNNLKQAKDLLGAMNQSEIEAAEQLSVKYDSLSRPCVALITRALADVLRRHRENGIPLTPFAKINEVTISDPNSIVRLLTSRGKRIPTTPFMRSKEVDKHPTLNALALMAGINRGSFTSVTQGRQHLSAKDLEAWRDALSQIGVYNDIEELAALSNPKTFLSAVIDEIINLESSMTVERVQEWAEMVETMEPDSIGQEFIDSELARARSVTLPHVFDSMVNIWRGQLIDNDIECFVARSLSDVLSTRTSSRRFSRGLQNLIISVHSGMGAFNSRVKYPARNYTSYKHRYSVEGETGLTSDILMAYCFYLGINPVAMVYWLAESEQHNPGSAFAMKGSYDPLDVVKWVGTISPVEYDKFIAATLSLGIVPDEMRFPLSLLAAKFVYPCMPDYNTLVKSLGSQGDAYRQPIEEYLSVLDTSTAECRLPRRYNSHLEAANSHDIKVRDIYDNVLASGYYVYGLSLQHGNLGEAVSSEMEDLESEAQIIEYAKEKLMQMIGGSESAYCHLVKDKDGDIDHSASCQARPFSPREMLNAAKLYRGLFESLSNASKSDDDDDLLSLMNG
ncbi:hypothetical protein vBVpaS1601_87 [Vibrio phage vB_VpaS_1601]|nr:hypothetical protein vBVpaP1601_87 [Vibrio phage vB_VpaP_1601]